MRESVKYFSYYEVDQIKLVDLIFFQVIWAAGRQVDPFD